ncbi:AMP-binding protein [Alphaproteobacteria bacterium]|jgi:acyl-CoA synthetase (AMP-forming)/AMP-acid ligase II|nr:AMP-binding protein [Alphaproteobacteria bacterium]
MTQTITAQLEANAKAAPDALWITSPDTGDTISWSQARSAAASIAAHLDALGLEDGAAVAIAAENSIWATLTFIGIACSGHMAVPLNLVAGARALAHVVSHSQTTVILCTDKNRELVTKALGDSKSQAQIIRLDPDHGPQWPGEITGRIKDEIEAPGPKANGKTPALLMYTSGTTGNPKGVVLNHANLLAAGMNVVKGHHLDRTDTTFCVLPTYHINGLCVSVMGTLMSAGGLVMPYRFSVSNFWQQISANNVSWFSAVPTLFAYLLNDTNEAEINHNRLRFARSASSPLSPEIHRRFEARFALPIIETLGLTETGAQILSNPMPPAQRKIGSAGIAVGNQIIIADSDQREIPLGETGEILVRGDNVMQHYFRQPDETEKTITPDGWLRTGDLGHMDEEGYVFVSGRIKELIIKGGENIAPREIDEALLEHDSVLEAAAFAVGCDQYGQRVEAGIRYKPGATASIGDLRQHCIERLGKFKAPDMIHVLDDLPKGPSGKIQRIKLFDIIYGQSE